MSVVSVADGGGCDGEGNDRVQCRTQQQPELKCRQMERGFDGCWEDLFHQDGSISQIRSLRAEHL
jgi:hypothetical protein